MQSLPTLNSVGLYVSNAPAADLQEFLNVLFSVVHLIPPYRPPADPLGRDRKSARRPL